MSPILLLAVGATLLVTQTQGGRIDPKLQIRLENGEALDVMIQFPSNSAIFKSPALLGIQDREIRITTMTSTMKERAHKNFKPFVEILTQCGLSNQPSVTNPLWISNVFEVKDCDIALAHELSRVPGDFVIREPVKVKILEQVETREVNLKEVRQNHVQWGVDKMQTPLAWNRTRGEGVVIGIIDTGVYLEHEALYDAYACRNGTNIPNCNGWADPYYNESMPTDVYGHGTHCIGSAIGRTYGIGVAPGAEWVACRGSTHDGQGTEANVIRCGQFMLDEANPRPHVVSNSWITGWGQQEDFFNDVLQAWIVAGIIPVFALGNFGIFGCGTAMSPGAQPYAISVGATTNLDTVATFSGRGPKGYILKPEVSAPGHVIISASSLSPDLYISSSGTSMATPHVAGVVALMLSQNPDLDFYQVKAILESTGDRPPVASEDRNCFPSQQEWPNNAFGNGRVNAARALGIQV